MIELLEARGIASRDAVGVRRALIMRCGQVERRKVEESIIRLPVAAHEAQHDRLLLGEAGRANVKRGTVLYKVLWKEYPSGNCDVGGGGLDPR